MSQKRKTTQISKKEWQASIAMLEQVGDSVKSTDPFASCLLQIAIDYMKDRLVGPPIPGRRSLAED